MGRGGVKSHHVNCAMGGQIVRCRLMHECISQHLTALSTESTMLSIMTMLVLAAADPRLWTRLRIRRRWCRRCDARWRLQT